MSSIVETVVVAPVLPGQGGGDDENQPASPRNQVNALGVGDSTFNTPPTQAQSKNLLLQARGLPSDVSRAIVDLVPLVCPRAPTKERVRKPVARKGGVRKKVQRPLRI